jgi:hypothetical protein
MRIRNVLTTLGTAAVVTATAAALAPTASADTVDGLPPAAPAFSRDEIHEGVLSPYGPDATCDSFHGSYVNCWQQRPDGRWQEMQVVDYASSGWTGDPLVIYPVWEDAGSLAALSS